MNVYRLSPANNSVALFCKREGDYRRVSELPDLPVAPENWEALHVAIIRDGSGGTEPSDLVLLGVEPAFTARAVEALHDILFTYGQIHPLRSEDGEFYLWNVTNVVDALDEEASSTTRFSSGRIMTVEKWAFKPSAVKGETAFKIPQQPRAFTFVTDKFLNRVHEERLIGFDLEFLWRSEYSPTSAV